LKYNLIQQPKMLFIYYTKFSFTINEFHDIEGYFILGLWKASCPHSIIVLNELFSLQRYVFLGCSAQHIFFIPLES